MRYFVLPILLFISACGFQPLHSEAYRSTLSASLAQVQINRVVSRQTQTGIDNSRMGELLKAEIEDGINPDAQLKNKLFSLQITLLETEVALFINPDGTSSRGDIQYHSMYTLTRLADRKIVDTGQINRVSSYNTSESADYSSFVSEEDAKKRGVIELAQDYKLRMANLLPRFTDESMYYENRPKATVLTPVLPTSTGSYVNHED